MEINLIISYKRIFCGYSEDPSYPKHKFKLMGEKVVTILYAYEKFVISLPVISSVDKHCKQFGQ